MHFMDYARSPARGANRDFGAESGIAIQAQYRRSQKSMHHRRSLVSLVRSFSHRSHHARLVRKTSRVSPRARVIQRRGHKAQGT